MKKLIMPMVLLLMMLVFPSVAGTISVSGGGNALQKAIDTAKAGDILLVEPGTYSAIDTQGKEIEIRSTKGPKQTFLTGGSKRLGACEFACVALLISDEIDSNAGEGPSYKYDTSKEWQTWAPSDLPGTTLVGFTIKPTIVPKPNQEGDVFAVVGGRLKNCIFPDVYFPSYCYLNLSTAINCLFVSGTLDEDIVADCCLWNCTVVTKAYVCTAELKNTIVYSTGSRAMELDGSCPIYNSIFFNVSGRPSTDPVFTDTGRGDYSLAQDSPCIDAGNNAYVFSDANLNGGARIINGTVDIGAYEFGSEYSWIENQDGSVTITEIRGDVSDVLMLPSQLGGKPVSAIGPGVLAGDEGDGVVPSIKTLIVPEGLRRIGEDSFSRCPYLAKIVLPKSLEEIGEGAFTAGADSLPFNNYKWKDYENFGVREIKVADGNESFGVKDGVLVDRKNGVAVVCCVSVTSVSLPEEICEIGEHCFAYCQSLSTIWFPSSLQTIGKEAFLFCRQLKALDFSGTSLSEIGKNAFGGCVNLTEVKFPASLEDIGKNAFYWCNALRSVTYEGNAPPSTEEIYMTSNDDLATPRLLPDAQRKETPLSHVVSYVNVGATGWGDIPGVWLGCPIQYIGSPVTSPIESSYGPFVPGEKVSLTISALIGYTAKKLPSGLKLNKKTGEIAGAAKKPTGDAGVTVTFTKKNGPTLPAQFVVGPIPTISVTLEGDTEKCKVTGANKAYLVGKKVSLQAKSPKGTAFVGWFKDGAPWPSEEEFLEPKIKYVMTKENLNLVARFEKERMSIDASVLQFAAFKVGAEVAEGAVVVNVETQSGLKSLKASKLPSGLKLKQNKATGVWSIYGKPKKAGGFTVTLKATAKSGAVETLVVPVTVGDKEQQIELPEWAVGMFSGLVRQIETDMSGKVLNNWYDVIAEVKVSETGKIDGRMECDDWILRFSFPGFTRVDSKEMFWSGKFVLGDLSMEGSICISGAGVLSLEFHEIGDYGEHREFFSTDESAPLVK